MKKPVAVFHVLPGENADRLRERVKAAQDAGYNVICRGGSAGSLGTPAKKIPLLRRWFGRCFKFQRNKKQKA